MRTLRAVLLSLAVALLLLLHACGGSAPEVQTPQRAQGFTFVPDKLASTGVSVELLDRRLQGEDSVAIRYRVGGESVISDTLIAFAQPFQRAICLSTTHVGFLAALGLTDRVVGVSTPRYVTNPTICQAVAQGKVVDIGTDMDLNYEAIVAQKPDICFAFATSGPKPPFVERLQGLGIPVVMVGEYLEEHPLARTEWLRVFGYLAGVGDRADAQYDSIAHRYDSVAQQVIAYSWAPQVLLNAPWKEVWYMPGATSYMCRLVRDAGGEVLNGGFQDGESHPVNLEVALALGLKADYWLHPGMATELQPLLDENAFYAQFPAVQQDKVWNNNLQLSPNGGNGFYEHGVLQPDVILGDLIAILHPGTSEEHAFTYYRHLARQ